MDYTSLRSAPIWIAYFAFCFSLVWAIETFSKVSTLDANTLTCFFFVTEACERLATTSSSAYRLFHPILTWIGFAGLAGLALTSLGRGRST